MDLLTKFSRLYNKKSSAVFLLVELKKIFVRSEIKLVLFDTNTKKSKSKRTTNRKDSFEERKMSAPGGYCATSPYVLKSSQVTVTKDEQVALLTTYVVCVVWITLNLVIFLWFKSRYARTKLRVSVYSFIYYLGVLSFATGYLLPYVYGFDKVPCWVTFALTASCLAFFNATNFTRSTTFMLMTRLSYATYQYGRIPIDVTNVEEEKIKTLNAWKRFRREIDYILFSFQFFYRTNRVKAADNREDHLKTLLALKFIASTRGSIMFASFCMIPWFAMIIVMCLAVPTYRENCYGCPPDHDTLIFTIICFGLLVALFAIIFAARCRNLPDVWGVFKEARLSAIGVVFSSISFIVATLGNFPGQYYFAIPASMGWAIGFGVITTFQLYLGRKKEMETQQGNKKSRSNYPNTVSSQHGTNTAEGGDMSSATATMTLANSSPCADLKGFRKLNEVLADPELRKAFEFHLSTEFGQENLSFLYDIHEWRSTFHDVALSAAIARAKKIYSTYISNDGLYQINIPATMSREIAEDLLSKNEKEDRVHARMFDKARTEVARLLEEGAIARFVRTSAYVNAASAKTLINAVA